ncbi:MAG: hypothetical protein AB1467_07340 [Candidatus Diapherotrites archaeon]
MAGEIITGQEGFSSIHCHSEMAESNRGLCERKMSEKTNLSSGDLTRDEFLKLLRETPWPGENLLLAFTPADARFEVFQFDWKFLGFSHLGRLFSSAMELKWRLVEGRLRVVYLGEPIPAFPLQDHSQLLSPLTQDFSELILWGVRTDLKDEWLEQQVPQRLVYQVSNTISQGRVALVVEHWIDKCRLPHFSRYHSLREIPGEDHAAG